MLRIDHAHEMSEYMDILSDSLQIHMENERLYRAYEDACYYADDYKHLATLWLKIESAGMFNYLNPDSIIDFLIRIGVDMERYARRNSNSYSLDKKRVIEPLIERGIAVELLEAYSKFKTYLSYSNSLKSLVNASPKFHTTQSGRMILDFPTHIEERENLRVYYSDINVIAVPKVFSNMITTQDDAHFIAWCDYPQADWRFAYNMFIRDEQNIQIMRSCSDAYEGLVRMVEGDAFNPEEFGEKRKEFKVHCLKVLYNSRDPAPVPTAIRKFYRSCTKYQRLIFDLTALYYFKLPIPCTSYFGYEQLLPEGAYADAFISKALNTPVQTMTSHVVNETVINMLHMFWDLGYTKDDVNIYYVRHDEFLLICSRKILKDAWVFKECSEIFIPGFSPIHLDFHFGNYYQQEDAQLTKQVEQSIAASDHVYYEPTEEELKVPAKDYWPYPSVESIYAQVFAHNGYSDVEFYNYRDGQRKTVRTGLFSEPETAVLTALNESGLSWLNNPAYVLVRTSGMDFMDYVGHDSETLVKIVDKPDTGAMISL